ncbi:hypothetical protein OOK29_09735 [Streptomyces phaeochromogenes]|uniref:hypothetical protein n=1 Tax=Streptomyces phaeochromogenes TaxID=1923 RepID=UPI0022542B8D|nr:hypothetical protein [Streptomyces phaeochromogenes]MCX5598418.1 hypothetical protein [Streptomyces phaeochromogenes]
MDEDERLFGIRCRDEGVIACETVEERDRLWDHMRKANGKAGCRIPVERLDRASRAADWVSA